MTVGSPVAIDLDALGDTRRLWDGWLRNAAHVLDVDPAELPRDRGEAASLLDQRDAGNWRSLLERFSEDHAGAYLRRDATASAALRALATDGRRLGVFTDAPEALTRVALAQLGAERRVDAVESGSGALERLLAELGAGTVVVRSRDELLAHAGSA